MNNIKLIGTDLDGTLLNDEKQLCRGARETLKKAARRGIYIVPVTGRPLDGVPECIRNLSEIEYLITSNGAQIVENATGRSLFSLSIDNKKSRLLMKRLRNINCMFEPFADGVGYAESDVYEYYRRTYSGTPIADYIFTSRVVCDSYEALFESGERTADEFFVNCPDESVREEVGAAAEELGGLQYCRLGNRFIEITALGCDKGEALAALCAHLGIDIEDTAAFGDGENDLTLLRRAGLAVAMENAFPSVKEKADAVAESNNDNGVCDFIEKYLNGAYFSRG